MLILFFKRNDCIVVVDENTNVLKEKLERWIEILTKKKSGLKMFNQVLKGSMKKRELL